MREKGERENFKAKKEEIKVLGKILIQKTKPF